MTWAHNTRGVAGWRRADEPSQDTGSLANSGIVFEGLGEDSQRLFQHTFGTHPQTFPKELKRDFFHNWLGGLLGVCSRGVL